LKDWISPVLNVDHHSRTVSNKPGRRFGRARRSDLLDLRIKKPASGKPKTGAQFAISHFAI
jgi:hypothetical protein